MKVPQLKKNPGGSAAAQAAWVHHHAGKILGVFFLLTLLAAPFAAKLPIRANLTELISEKMQSVRNLNRLQKLIGGTTYHVAVFESENRETADKAARLFEERAAQMEHVKSVEGGKAVFPKSMLLFFSLESLRELEQRVDKLMDHYRRTNNPFYIDLLDEEPPEIKLSQMSLEKKVYRFAVGNPSREEGTFKRFVLIRPDYPLNDFEQSEKFFAALADLFDEIKKTMPGEITLGFTGAYQTRYDEYKTVMDDLRVTGFASFISVTFIMAVFFQSKRMVLLALAILGAAIVWAGAFAHWTVGYLNLISTLLLAILLGLGIDYVIHFFSRYRQCRIQTDSPQEALGSTYSDVGRPLWAGALTTSAAFFSLLFSRFLGFSHFGLIAGAGILICCGVVFYGLPAAITGSERLLGNLRWKDPFRLNWKAAGLHRFRISLAVVTAGIVFTLYSLIQLPQLRFDYNFANLQNQDTPSIRLSDEARQYFEIYMNPVALITQDRREAGRLQQMITEYIGRHPETKIDFATSRATYPPSNQEEKTAILSRIRSRLEAKDDWIQRAAPAVRKNIDRIREQLSPEPVTVENLPQQIKRQYESGPGPESMVYIYPAVNIMEGRDAQAFIREVKSLPVPENVILAGEPIVYTDILTMLDEDVPRAILMSVIIVPLILLIFFRRGTYVLLSLVPVFLGLLWMTGLMRITGLQFNYFNASLIPGLIGVMIDNGIHILHRSVREKDIEFGQLFQKTGKAVMFSGLTTMAAFASLTLAKHSGTASLGYLGVIGFGSGLVAAVFFMPAVFTLLKHWKIRVIVREQS